MSRSHVGRHYCGSLVSWTTLQDTLFLYIRYKLLLYVDVWDSYENMAGNQNMGNAWKEAHPDLDQEEMYEKISKMRDLKKAEIWINITRAEVEAKPDESSAND